MAGHDNNCGGEDDYRGCAIPPEVYEIGFGWDPAPEIQRLLFMARTAGTEVRSALELGCGTGRLLRALRDAGVEAVGLELSTEMAARARESSGAEVIIGDMTAFDLGRSFDLIYSSANTIRHVLDDEAIARMWGCVGEHLVPGGVFVADLELGVAAEAAKVGKPVMWSISRGEQEVGIAWEVVEPPDSQSHIARIEWSFTLRAGGSTTTRRESFVLRTWDAGEFVSGAEREGALELLGLYELRDPYLFERCADNAVGRFLAALRRRSDAGE